MLDTYIRDYQVNLLENTYNDDLERLKAICYGLEYILTGMEYNLETNEDKYNYNKMTACLLILKEIIKEQEEKETIPQF